MDGWFNRYWDQTLALLVQINSGESVVVQHYEYRGHNGYPFQEAHAPVTVELDRRRPHAVNLTMRVLMVNQRLLIAQDPDGNLRPLRKTRDYPYYMAEGTIASTVDLGRYLNNPMYADAMILPERK